MMTAYDRETGIHQDCQLIFWLVKDTKTGQGLVHSKDAQLMAYFMQTAALGSAALGLSNLHT